MSYEDFIASMAEDAPPASMSDELRSLWHAAKGDWDTSHTIAQDIDTQDGSWIHAYLHREEGDIGNARYWYSRSGHPEYHGSTEDEREQLIREFLER